MGNTKQEVLKIIIDAADLYQNNLLNTNILFVYKSEKDVAFFEAAFKEEYFAHLTGAVYNKAAMSAEDFYTRCATHRLSINDFELAKDNSTYLKSTVLCELMKVHRTAKAVGEYNSSRPLLYTEKLVGNVRGCMGFCKPVEENGNGLLIPNTVLRTDIRDITSGTHQLLATYQKQSADERYSVLTYLAKPLKEDLLKWPDRLRERLEENNMKTAFGK